MKKRMKNRKVLCFLIVLIMTVSILMPANVTADFTLEIQMDTEQGQKKTVISDLRITELEAPQAGFPFPTQATVVSAEGVNWKVAVLWMDENGIPVSGIAGEGSYCPVIVFFVPSEYTVRGNDGKPGSFRLSIDDSVLALFGTNRLFSVFDAGRGITYILNGKTNISKVRQEESVIPSQSVAGMPEEYQTPEDGYRSQNHTDRTEGENHAETMEIPAPEEGTPADAGAKEEAAPEESTPADAGAKEDVTPEESTPTDADKTEKTEPVKKGGSQIPEIVSIHCSKTAMDAMDVNELASLVDLVKYRLQPQATELLRKSFPAYQEAGENNQLGEQIGLYVYFDEGDKDDIPGHKSTVEDAIAYVASGNLPNQAGDFEYKYILGVNARFFVKLDEVEEPIYGADGKARLANDEKALITLENTIVHEMMHTFMSDYNRLGMSGIADPSILSDLENDKEGTAALAAHMTTTSFPTWFREGLATSVENNYQFRYESFNLLSYAGEGQISDKYSPEILRNAYTTSVFRVDPKKPEHKTCFDLEMAQRTDMNPNQIVDANYVSGYLACLYIGELAANRTGNTSRYMGEDGNYVFRSDVIREGINTVLRRLHEGETLDEVISSISEGRFADTQDFEQKFIKGNEESADFCSGYLNYMRELSQDKNRKYLPNGSILFPFDCDYATPLDRTKYGDSALFRIIDSTDFVLSTADLEDVADAGRSVTYDEYIAGIREVEVEIAELEMLEAVIDELAGTLTAGDNIDPDLYNFIVDEVLEAQIVDEEKKDSIILEARELAEVMEDAVPEEGDKDADEDENPDQEEEPDEDENPGQDEDPDEDENSDQEDDPAALEEDLYHLDSSGCRAA